MGECHHGRDRFVLRCRETQLERVRRRGLLLSKLDLRVSSFWQADSQPTFAYSDCKIVNSGQRWQKRAADLGIDKWWR